MDDELVASIIHDAALTLVFMVATIVPVLVLERGIARAAHTATMAPRTMRDSYAKRD
jgi:hypothetical protein